MKRIIGSIFVLIVMCNFALTKSVMEYAIEASNLGLLAVEQTNKRNFDEATKLLVQSSMFLDHVKMLDAEGVNNIEHTKR